MRIELYLLGATLILALVQILLTAHLRTRQYGITWNAGARDDKMPALKPLPARMLRAQENLFETLPSPPAASPIAIWTLLSLPFSSASLISTLA